MANSLVSFFTTLWDVIYFSIYLFLLYIQALFRYFIPPAMKSLSGEIILITGSANGIGREICMQLSQAKATLVCWDINQPDNELLVQELRRTGTRAYGFAIDVSDRAAVEVVGLRVQREVGPVSIIINNAGILPCHSLLSHNPREITRCFEVNLFSHFWILRHFLPGMIERRKGHIVSMSSVSAMGGAQNLVPYSASKGAVHCYMESLRAELQAHPDKPDIKLTTVYPAICRTGLLQNIRANSRFPSLLGVLEPDFVARKTIEGFRRNYNQVFIPGYMNWMQSYLTCQPIKIKMAIVRFLKYYLEPEEKVRNGS